MTTTLPDLSKKWQARRGRSKSGPLHVEPGIYEDMPFDDYTRIEAVNNSSLKLAAMSMRHYRYGTAPVDAADLRIGDLIHKGKLEPDLFERRYVVMPPYHKDPDNTTQKGDRTESKNTTYYRDRRSQFEEQAQRDGKIVVDHDWFVRMKSTLAAINGNREARRNFSQGKSELTIVWLDITSGLLCKGRIDFLNTKFKRRRLVDLKTTADITRWSVSDYDYHRQAAFYTDGWQALTDEETDFHFVVAEKTQPFCVNSAPIHPKAIYTGRTEYQYLLHEIANCIDNKRWPGPPDPSHWELSPYYRSFLPTGDTSE